MHRALILHTVINNNILPLTSYCNSNCIFCSHAGNPQGLDILYIGSRDLNEVFEDIPFLDPSRDIVIGESATRIVEGEPFLYKGIDNVLRGLRDKYLNTKIKITTNGMLLKREVVVMLKDLDNIEINLSINTASSENYSKIMGISVNSLALKEGFWLKEHNIPFHGSIVAMPWLTGWNDIEETVKYLEGMGALTVRVFLPGYTEFSPEILKFPKTLNSQLYDYISSIRNQVKIPVLLEPPMLEDLTPSITGVIPASKVDKLGLKPGDVILKVNGEKVFSRVDAWQRITKLKDPEVHIQSGKEIGSLIINKERNEKSGIVCDFDIDWKRVQELKLYQDEIYLFTSELAWPLLVKAIEKMSFDHVRVIPVKNITFGGSIACAGLLTLKDIENELANHQQLKHLLLPREMFDNNGKDLFDNHFSLISEGYNLKVNLI